MSYLKPRSALLSVSDKTGLVPFARGLMEMGISLYATGGTCRLLQEAGLTVQSIEVLTGLPSMMAGRVKTLHPGVMGGILADRQAHADDMARHDLVWIDMVVVNLYPFERVLQSGQADHASLIEEIDIGGVTLLRSAAKNHRWVAAVSRTQDYPMVLSACEGQGISDSERASLATVAFATTLHYEHVIFRYFYTQAPQGLSSPPLTVCAFDGQALPYGENPHQTAMYYTDLATAPWSLLQGKALSYNNWLDTQAGIDAIKDVTTPAVVIIKHTTPCGMATASTLVQAFVAAYACNKTAAYGGIVVINGELDAVLARELLKYFTECVVAPSVSEDALTLFASKPGKRLLSYPTLMQCRALPTVKRLAHGWLQQMTPTSVSPEFEIICGEVLSESQWQTVDFAWQVVRAVLSNAIVICQDQATVGIGGGQVSRVAAAADALRQADQQAVGAVMASDGFLPFADTVEHAAEAGIAVIVEPGGSKRDPEVIAACHQHGITLVFTHQRVFRH